MRKLVLLLILLLPVFSAAQTFTTYETFDENGNDILFNPPDSFDLGFDAFGDATEGSGSCNLISPRPPVLTLSDGTVVTGTTSGLNETGSAHMTSVANTSDFSAQYTWFVKETVGRLCTLQTYVIKNVYAWSMYVESYDGRFETVTAVGGVPGNYWATARCSSTPTCRAPTVAVCSPPYITDYFGDYATATGSAATPTMASDAAKAKCDTAKVPNAVGRFSIWNRQAGPLSCKVSAIRTKVAYTDPCF